MTLEEKLLSISPPPIALFLGFREMRELLQSKGITPCRHRKECVDWHGIPIYQTIDETFIYWVEEGKVL